MVAGKSAHESIKKLRERAQLDRVRQLYPGCYPLGEPEAGEEPDFVFPGEERVGVEITQLFHLPGQQAHSPREVESFHLKVMWRAERLAAEEQLPPVNVLVNFLSGRELRHANRMAGALVAFVGSNLPAGDTPETHTLLALDGFATVRIYRHASAHWWRCAETSYVRIVSREQLASTIAQKNALVPMYRLRADRVWLLITTDTWPLSSSFSVSEEIDRWVFRFDFDKVLLFSADDGRMYDLGR